METDKLELEKIAGKYDPSSPENDFDFWLIHFDFESLRKFLIGKKVIEMGCGRGVLTEKLARICKELIVVEGSKKNINYVKEKLKSYSNIRFYHSLWQKFQYEKREM